MKCDCVFMNSVIKYEGIPDISRVCTSCDILDRYKQLVDEGKIDFITDLANFRREKHENNKKRSVNNGSKNNKCNKRRTISKGREESKKSN